MKRGLLAGLRALLVAICILLLATVAGYPIKSVGSVAVFFLFIAGIWILVERALMTAAQRKKAKPGSH
jgi:uncharacterized membrane protein